MKRCSHFAVDPMAAGAGCSCGMVWTPQRGWYEPDKRIQSHRALTPLEWLSRMLRHHSKLCHKALLGYRCQGRDQYRECS
jgi:hypothetical protein